MDRIIIREVDNTSNVETLSSYDVAYVPGFSAGPASDDYTIESFYRKPTLVTDKYDFIRKFGSSAPRFAYSQAYPSEFPDVAVQWSNLVSGYDLMPTNNFTSAAEIVDVGGYSVVTEAPSEIAEGYTYYSLSIDVENSIYTLAEITGNDSAAIIAEITEILEDSQGNGVYLSTKNPKEIGWYEKDGENNYVKTNDTKIIATKNYYYHEDGIPNMFNGYYRDDTASHLGDADPGWRYAYALLSVGMPVYYEQMNSSYDSDGRLQLFDDEPALVQDDMTVEKMYEGLELRFIGKQDPDVPADVTFDSMGDYSVKFITSGGYPTFEYNNNSLATAMAQMAMSRQDSIALIDHTDNPTRPLASWDEKSVISAVREWSGIASYENYAAMFTPWFECSNPVVNSDNGTAITNDMMPGSFAYLTSLAVQLQTYNPWLAVSGVTRGRIPYCAGLHTNETLTNNIADSYQTLPSQGQGNNISINPITNIRNYGFCIWGNRTLRNNANGTKASSFLNIRSAVSDIKKRLYEASQRLLFEQNTDVLWLNFRSLITPLLETMKTDYILNDYSITRLMRDPETGAAVPAYEVMAIIRIQPINSVEIFDLTIYLENNAEFDIRVTTVEGE